jgi:hypothetical protein
VLLDSQKKERHGLAYSLLVREAPFFIKASNTVLSIKCGRRLKDRRFSSNRMTLIVIATRLHL